MKTVLKLNFVRTLLWVTLWMIRTIHLHVHALIRLIMKIKKFQTFCSGQILTHIRIKDMSLPPSEPPRTSTIKTIRASLRRVLFSCS